MLHLKKCRFSEFLPLFGRVWDGYIDDDYDDDVVVVATVAVARKRP